MQRAMGGSTYAPDSEFSSGPGAIAAIDGASPARRNIRKRLQARSMMRDRRLAGLGAAQAAMTKNLLGAGRYTTLTPPIAVGPPVKGPQPAFAGRNLSAVQVSPITGRPYKQLTPVGVPAPTAPTAIYDPSSMYGNPSSAPVSPAPPASTTTPPTSSSDGGDSSAGSDAGIPSTPPPSVTLTPPASPPDDGSFDTGGGGMSTQTLLLIGAGTLALVLLLRK